jgi:hypothetical protein
MPAVPASVSKASLFDPLLADVVPEVVLVTVPLEAVPLAAVLPLEPLAAPASSEDVVPLDAFVPEPTEPVAEVATSPELEVPEPGLPELELPPLMEAVDGCAPWPCEGGELELPHALVRAITTIHDKRSDECISVPRQFATARRATRSAWETISYERFTSDER